MSGNDYLEYELQVGPNEWTSWGTAQMMAADDFVNCVCDRTVGYIARMRLDNLRVEARWEVCGEILEFRNRVIAQSFRLPRLKS